MKKIRNVLFLTHGSFDGGANLCLLDIIRNLDRSRFNPIVIMPNHGWLDYQLSDLDVDYYIFRYAWWIVDNDYGKLHLLVSRFRYFIQSIVATKRIACFCKKKQIDIIHSNSCTIEIGQAVSKKMHIPHVWHVREILTNYAWRWVIGKRHLFRSFSSAQSVICISEFVRTYLESECGEKIKSVHVIYDGVEECDTRERKFDRFTVLSQAGTWAKGKDEVINVLRELRDCKIPMDFYVIGDEHEYQGIGNEYLNIRMFRGLPLDEYRRFRSRCHISLTTSINEAFGRITVEPMSEGTLVIAANRGASPELIHDGVDGILYEYGNANDLKEKIIDVANHYEDYQLMIENARINAKRFTAKENAFSVMKQYDALFQEVDIKK